MEKAPRYRRHTPIGSLALAGFRALISLCLFTFAVKEIVRALLTGAIALPSRGAEISVTTADPIIFGALLAVWLCMASLFGGLTYLFAKRLWAAFKH